MLPGQTLHLDHRDDRTGYGGFSHASCNVRAAAKKARRLQVMRKGKRLRSAGVSTKVDRRLSQLDDSRVW